VFTPTLDSSNNPSILYKQTRYRSGDADLVQADGTVDIGTVTGTAVPSFVSTVTPTMTFEENTVTSLFSGKTIGITETLDPNITGVTYTVELEVPPTTVGLTITDAQFTSNASAKIILNGTKAEVNEQIQNLQVTPLADTNIDFDILYSQTRHITGSADVVQATDVNIGTATGTDSDEFVYGTANENIQYFVHSEFLDGVDTNATRLDIISDNANVRLTPKQLTLNKGLQYERPITIVDTTVDAVYKIVFSGGTLFTIHGASLNMSDTDWQTKEDLHGIIENDFYVSQSSNVFSGVIIKHNTTYTANFTIFKKTYTGVETQMASGQLKYKFQTGIELWKPTFYGFTYIPAVPGFHGGYERTDILRSSYRHDISLPILETWHKQARHWPIGTITDETITGQIEVRLSNGIQNAINHQWNLHYDAQGNVTKNTHQLYPYPDAKINFSMYPSDYDYDELGYSPSLGTFNNHSSELPRFYASNANIYVGANKPTSTIHQLWNSWGVRIKAEIQT